VTPGEVKQARILLSELKAIEKEKGPPHVGTIPDTIDFLEHLIAMYGEQPRRE
jgi:hypothetical protein